MNSYLADTDARVDHTGPRPIVGANSASIARIVRSARGTARRVTGSTRENRRVPQHRR